MFGGVKNSRTRNVGYVVVYEKSALRFDCFGKADVELVHCMRRERESRCGGRVSLPPKKEPSALNCIVEP